MRFYNFEYDGINLSDKGFIICNFDSGSTDVASNGSYITFNTAPMMQGAKHDLTSIEYKECLKATFDICKHPCLSEYDEISLDETRDIMRWLNRKEFHKFRFLDIEYMDIYFEASFNVNKVEINGKLYGFELEMITNRPFATHEPISISIEAEANTVYKVTSDSDEEGYIYPEMEITVNSSGDLNIHNALEDRHMYIANCKAGEIIKANYPIIETSLDSHKIQNDFNWKFFRIATSYTERINEITTSLPCSIKMKYSPVVKIGI